MSIDRNLFLRSTFTSCTFKVADRLSVGDGQNKGNEGVTEHIFRLCSVSVQHETQSSSESTYRAFPQGDARRVSICTCTLKIPAKQTVALVSGPFWSEEWSADDICAVGPHACCVKCKNGLNTLRCRHCMRSSAVSKSLTNRIRGFWFELD